MKFNAQSLLKVLSLCALSIFFVSCSKDSDLLSEYVLADTLDARSLETALLDDSYQVSLTGSMILDVLANDSFENDAAVVIAETSAPTNGTLVINTGETLTYTPNPEIIAQVVDTTNASTPEVVDTFTYTAEVVNEEGTTTSEVANVVITTGDNSLRSNEVSNISPFSYCQDGNPIGGGVDYDAILSSADADIHITTNISRTSFKSLVEGARIGDVIFIDGGVTIDLTGLNSASILVKQGVTIASDRGHASSLGALIKTNDMAYQGNGNAQPVFKTTGINTRFTGFRLQGPYGDIGVHSLNTFDIRLKHGIASNYNNTEVDNMELYNWPFSAVIFGQFSSTSYFGPNQFSDGHLYHHNYAHHNRQNRFGYGVNIQSADVDVYANLFQYNRHDVAAGGRTSPNYSGYDAYCNTVLEGGTHHNFDMHGDKGNVPGTIAGKFIYIHHNDFQDVGLHPSRGKSNKENIRISGNPEEIVNVANNRFAHPNISIAYKILYLTGPAKEEINNNTFNGN